MSINRTINDWISLAGHFWSAMFIVLTKSTLVPFFIMTSNDLNLTWPLNPNHLTCHSDNGMVAFGRGLGPYRENVPIFLAGDDPLGSSHPLFWFSFERGLGPSMENAPSFCATGRHASMAVTSRLREVLYWHFWGRSISLLRCTFPRWLSHLLLD